MYAIKNLRNLVLNNKIVFSLIVVCIFVSTLVIHFSYGIYQNYNVVIEQGESEYLQINIDFDNKPNDYVKLNKLLECINSFSKDLRSNIDYCSVGQDQQIYRETYYNMEKIIDSNGNEIDPGKSNFFYFSFGDDGRLTDSKTIRSNYINNNFIEGRWFKEDEWNQGKQVCLVGLGNNIQRVLPYIDENGKVVYTIEHDGVVETNSYTDEFGDKFEVIGISQIGSSIFPIHSVNRNYRIDIFYLEFLHPITAEQYKELSNLLETYLGEYVNMPEIEFSESKNIYLYRTILLICVLVSIAAGINFAILFNFILIKRRKMLGIFRLCGCTSSKSMQVLLTECIAIIVPIYILGTILYDRLIMAKLSLIYPYIEAANSIRIYLILGLIYIGVTTIVSLIMIIKNISTVSIVSIQKGND